MIFIRF